MKKFVALKSIQMSGLEHSDESTILWKPVSKTNDSVDMMAEPNIVMQLTLSARHKKLSWAKFAHSLQASYLIGFENEDRGLCSKDSVLLSIKQWNIYSKPSEVRT